MTEYVRPNLSARIRRRDVVGSSASSMVLVHGETVESELFPQDHSGLMLGTHLHHDGRWLHKISLRIGNGRRGNGNK